jgi:uncharacterized protein
MDHQQAGGARAPRCPICKKAARREEMRAFPFCSERCRAIDLGNWLGESYRIPAHEDEDGAELDSGDDGGSDDGDGALH